MAFLTDFRENPSTLSTDGDVVAAEDIALLGETHREGRAVNTITSNVRLESSQFAEGRMINHTILTVLQN